MSTQAQNSELEPVRNALGTVSANVQPAPVRRPGKKSTMPVVSRATTCGVSKVRRSYTREMKLKILSCCQNMKIPVVDKDGSEKLDSDGKPVLRSITRPEVAYRFKVPESNLSVWKRLQDKILDSKKGSQYATVEATFRCKWPELERGLWEAFLK